MSFVHLHNHTHYSLLDGLTKIDELVDFAKDQGSPAAAISDHGVMYGAIDFYQKCLKSEIKPIVGCELYLAPESRHDKTSRQGQKTNFHLLLLAKDIKGYKNLLKMVSIGHLEGFYYKPRIDWEVLREHKDGLIASSACLSGEIPHLILAGKYDEAKKRASEFASLFGEGNYFLELQHHPSLPEQIKANEGLIQIAKELGVGLVATNDVHYLKKEDNEAQDILLCLQNKKKRDDADRMSMMDSDFSMRPTTEMKELFSHVPEAIKNTLEIAGKCDLNLELGKIMLPYFEVPEKQDENGYLRELCLAGLEKRYNKKYEEVDQRTRERMDYELKVISDMGWPSYFLIVADFVSWAKKKKIVVGPGRGSAAGSLVCYLTGITNIDPLEYDLLFERFLNPERVSMPDIDLDFSDARRDEVINYVGEKYGHDHVAQIITFGTMAARAAVRDVGRVLGIAYDYCDKLAKMIPMFSSLDEALKVVPELKEAYSKERDARTILDFAKRLEGVARHASTHACGVLITKDPLTENTPVQYASTSDKTLVSQYSLHPVEDLGLLKMDFLGLKNLTIIESAIKIIKKAIGDEIDIENIPLEDADAYRLFQGGETTGVFQFESSGMKRYLRELKPSEFEDIIAMVALYRPGPMEWIPDYVDRKHGKKKIEYIHPKLEPILKKTYGVAIYQEQVMQIARDLAGFSLGEADVLRKAMGKKIVELLAEQKNKFIDGCVQNGINKDLAKKVFAFIEPFAGYGFNRSHAACYALIGYQTAYLKAHYPTEFMAALLTADQENTDRVAIEIEECRNMGIEVLPPDINESFATFTVVPSDDGSQSKTIRFGLRAIKNVGEHIVEVLIDERKKNGAFKDIFDLIERVTDKDLNKKSLEALIKSGSLDGFDSRSKLLANLDNLLAFSREINKEKMSGQDSLFGQMGSAAPVRMKLVDGDKIDPRQKLDWERELLGLYITEHPFNRFKKELSGFIKNLVGLAGFKGMDVNIAGVVTAVKKIITRKNESMLFVKIEDALSSVEILVFPKLLQKDATIWEEGKVLIIKGKVSDKDQEIKILADKACELDDKNIAGSIKNFSQMEGSSKNGNGNFYRPNTNEANFTPVKPVAEQPLKIIFKQEPAQDILNRLKSVFLENSGSERVFFKLKNGEKENIIETAFRVDNNENLKQTLRQNFETVLEVAE